MMTTPVSREFEKIAPLEIAPLDLSSSRDSRDISSRDSRDISSRVSSNSLEKLTEQRKKNNEASRRWRKRRKMKEQDLKRIEEELHEKNKKLLAQVEQLEYQLECQLKVFKNAL